MNDQYLVSVIVPTHRRPFELDRCLKSLSDQTHKNIEVVVVNDSGNDHPTCRKTDAVVEKYRGSLLIRYVKNEVCLGGAVSRNLGIGASNGSYVCFLDDDDEFEPEKVSKQLNFLLSNTAYDAAYCGYGVFCNGKHIEDKRYTDEGDLRLKILMLENGMCAGSTLMISRVALDGLVGFDEGFKRHQDWEFMMRFFEKYLIGVVGDILVRINLDDATNRANPDAVEQAKSDFLRKFKSVIEGYGREVAYLIYYKNYFELSKFFIYNRNYVKARYYYDVASEYCRPTLLHRLKIIGFFLDSYVPFYQKWVKIRRAGI